ncbi:MAG: TonB-dependent receptor [Lutibacter sp.]|uniref:TonB-dependent receptor plug domain-containing protein n=1 Tax=Lutibacter sp. TaxID=1925666 RepID=UPI001A0AE3DF|nr:TonB-dependent receptor plug domain-containing protein [Lutibacter sp.]NOR29316.1 TonB-dependent receptor [Lutibacter sp.]
MDKLKISFIVSLLFTSTVFSQKTVNDTTKIIKLNEVIIINRETLNNKKQVKPLASIDEYLEKSNKVTMIKRGNYAWEPAINNMVSDRISVTIDGMQIFGACTDKMDPITSYVDVSNLSEVHVKSGQQGSENGSTIGGGIDLKLQKSNLDTNLFNIGFDTGYETNGNAKIISSEINFSNKKYFVNADAIYRNSGNYSAGGNEEILYSQYEKYNFSTVAGIKVSEQGTVVGSIIFDEATDIGYPALTMDVSLAKALITSISYQHKNKNSSLSEWETKLYFNAVTHVMDDTKRINVPIHMDMPGWSDTYGFYSKFKIKKAKHNFLFNANAYYNKSLAEMTMYPNDPEENVMFMLTWPDVRTLYSGVYGEDNLVLNSNSKLKVTTRIGFQNETISNEFGLNSLKIFYPNMDDNQSRILVNISSQYEYVKDKFQFLGSVGYGERAPSVTEAYGFYLFNSFDNYDYIGNPYLINEKSIELNAAVNYSSTKLKIGLEASYFHISNYIIGEFDANIDRMTIGADGVKIYKALDYATILNTNFSTEYHFSKLLLMNASLGYSIGKDQNSNNLPLISPLNYKFGLHFKKDLFDAEFGLSGAAKQRNFSRNYGEDETDSYLIFNTKMSYSFQNGSDKILIKSGVENIFDTYYSTYADWKNIPRMGRNIFVNISYVIK